MGQHAYFPWSRKKTHILKEKLHTLSIAVVHHSLAPTTSITFPSLLAQQAYLG